MARKTPTPREIPTPPPFIPFSRLIGHHRPLAILQAAMRSDRVAHAYLFLGSPGIGKFTTACALARRMLCSGNESAKTNTAFKADSCGKCRSCLLFKQGSHPDFSVIQPDGSFIKVEQITELQKAATLKPYLSTSKWFILDHAEQMKPEAANRFLKTLEEPPGQCHFILVSSRGQALLGTIRSRCQLLQFATPASDEIRSLLAENRELDSEEARLLWTLSGKNIGAALEADPVELQSERDNFINLISSIWLDDIEPLFKIPGEMAPDQETLRETLVRLEIWLRDVLVAKAGASPDLLENEDISNRVYDWAGEMDEEALLNTLDLIHRFRRASPRNLNTTLVLETILLSLREGRRKQL